MLHARPTAATALQRRRGPAGRAMQVVAVLVVVAVAWVGSIAGRVWWVARLDERPPSGAIVVLGASQWNGRPAEVFSSRLDHAAELWGEGVAPLVVTVGGKQPGDRTTEADAGREYLVDLGVPAEQVLAVPVGRDTWRSMRAVSEALDERGIDSVVLVSDPWHVFRSEQMAEHLGLAAATSPTRSGPAVWTRQTQVRAIARESLAYVWWRLGGGAPWRGPDLT